MKYFSLVGSYEGGVLYHGKWIRVQDLNKIDKRGWERHQGPLTAAQAKALLQNAINAIELFPNGRTP